MFRMTRIMFLVVLFLLCAVTVNAGANQVAWLDKVLAAPSPRPSEQPLTLQLLRQDSGQPNINKSMVGKPITIGKQQFEHGIGMSAISLLRVVSPQPIKRFSAWVGIDNNENTQGRLGTVTFSVLTDGQELYQSKVLRGGYEPERIDVDTKDAKVLDLKIGDAGDGVGFDTADWAEATITTSAGEKIRLDQMKLEVVEPGPRCPFSFIYEGKQSDDLLDGWRQERKTEKLDADRTRITTTWTDPATGLKLHWEATRYYDFPAAEWLLYFENTGSKDTAIVENVQALDVTFTSPITFLIPYRLHKTNGVPANKNDYASSVVVLDEKHPESMGGLDGQSSNKDFPFFKIETGDASVIVAVGWTGQWKADFVCPSKKQLHVTSGLEKTHFLLHPGEKVRSPRMLVMYWQGDTLESNAQFRQLIYKHYAAKRAGKTLLPTLFCNTCFTRGGNWGLNGECNEQNQISLIKAFAPLGLEALCTDAGWYEGRNWEELLSWNPRKDLYPNGMGPVAAAAKENNMIYGLWFSPERQGSFALPEVRDFMFNVVKGLMELPGFRFYRQDGATGLGGLRRFDTPDRQGITEMQHFAGMYEWWDRIASNWPDSLREMCTNGGRRIDLETIMRMHIHQDSDYWFDYETDQGQIWGASQYLPNNCMVGHINKMDDYSFRSVMASSLCLGWIADAPDFDLERAKKLVNRYREVRHLVIGAWYPLLLDHRDLTSWSASQYHRPDLNEGMILVFRREESPIKTIQAQLHGLDANATYELTSDNTAEKTRAKGSELMKGFEITLPERHMSDLIQYCRAK